jgi:phage antirepressor YoqD-like protein
MKDQHSYSIKTSAKLVRFTGGQRKFLDWLKDHKFLMASNEPYQKYINRGWFQLDLVKIPCAGEKYVSVPRVTIKGLAILEQRVFNQFHKCKPCNDDTTGTK